MRKLWPIWQNLLTKANHSAFSIRSAWKRRVRCICTIPGTFNIFIKKCLEKKCLLHPNYPRHFKYLQKNCLAKKFLNIRTIPGTFKMSIKSAWRRSVLCIRMFPGTFYIFKKSAWQKVSFTSALTQARKIFSVVSSPVTFCIFGEKSA